MKAVVTYESVYGNTAEVARAIGEGLEGVGTVVVLPGSDEVVHHELDDADLLVVGGPTHVHGMSTNASRRAAVDATTREEEAVEPEGEAVRELLDRIGDGGGMAAAAFDTRMHGPRLLTGSAATAIGRRLRRHGFALIAEPESFVVAASEGPLAEGEHERAVAFGRALARTLTDHAAAS